MIFAVVTVNATYVYDTQHVHPVVKISGLHYAAINDAAWSCDGRVLSFCSSDGYVSFVRFESGALGKFLQFMTMLHSIVDPMLKESRKQENY
jgi:hypothetical protein